MFFHGLAFSSILILTCCQLRAGEVSLTVSAAMSLKPVLEKLKVNYGKIDPGVTIVYNFGSSGSLQQQIVHGAPVDIFISAASRQMDELEAGEFILPGSRFVLAYNSVTLIAPAGSQNPTGFDGLSSPVIRTIAIGEPNSVPVGMYAMQIFEHLGLGAAVKSKLVFAKDVRQVLFYVESGNADAGIVYATDAAGSGSVRVVANAPDASHQMVEYAAAVLKTSAHPAGARAFLKYLRSPDAVALFKSAGFDTTAPR